MKPTVMNKKRKILTVVAMVAFGAIIALHYVTDYTDDEGDVEI